MDVKLFCSGEYVLKKCVYNAFAAKVFSELEAKEVIERVGKLVKTIDVCPFAIRLMTTTTQEEQQELEQRRDQGEVEAKGLEGKDMEDSQMQQKHNYLYQKEQLFSEDNGDLGIGGLLCELLASEGTENMILLVTRVVKGTFPPEMINQSKFAVIKEAGLAALRALMEYLDLEMEKALRAEQQRLQLTEEAKNLLDAQITENELTIRDIDKELGKLELEHNKVTSACSQHESTKASFEALLSEIESAADERSKYELEMELAEDLDTQLQESRIDNYTSKAHNTKSIEAVKSKYFKAKECLNQLRVEKKEREPEYREIMRKFKAVDNVASEIGRLKDAQLKCFERRIELEKERDQFEASFS